MNHVLVANAGDLAETLCRPSALAVHSITPTERGAIAEADRYCAKFCDGTLAKCPYKMTGEEYLDTAVKTGAVLPHLLRGLGAHNAPVESEAVRRCYDSPWVGLPTDGTWPNRHCVEGQSVLRTDGDGFEHSLVFTGAVQSKTFAVPAMGRNGERCRHVEKPQCQWSQR